MKTRIATPSDLPGVLQLQNANLYSNLTAIERKKGFVTTPFSEKQILEIIPRDGLFVAEENEKIIAYVFAAEWGYFTQWPIFPFMTARFPMLNFNGIKITTEDSFQYGPICIDADFRGKQIMPLIFEEMRLTWLPKFALSITFINQINQVSLRAHAKLGWKEVDRFDFNGNKYLCLAFAMQNSVMT